MSIVVDIIIVAIILLSTFLAYRKGLISLAIQLVAFVIAIALTLLLYKPVSNVIINVTGIDEAIQNAILEEANDIMSNDENGSDQDHECRPAPHRQAGSDLHHAEARLFGQGESLHRTGGPHLPRAPEPAPGYGAGLYLPLAGISAGMPRRAVHGKVGRPWDVAMTSNSPNVWTVRAVCVCESAVLSSRAC